LGYHPYGMLLNNRHGSVDSDSYRYGFQGQERDDEVKGEGNSYNYKYRMHDVRLGRFFAVDPLTTKYAYYTPYQFSGNKVIHAKELEGLEENITIILNSRDEDVKPLIKAAKAGNIEKVKSAAADLVTKGLASNVSIRKNYNEKDEIIIGANEEVKDFSGKSLGRLWSPIYKFTRSHPEEKWWSSFLNTNAKDSGSAGAFTLWGSSTSDGILANEKSLGTDTFSVEEEDIPTMPSALGSYKGKGQKTYTRKNNTTKTTSVISDTKNGLDLGSKAGDLVNDIIEKKDTTVERNYLDRFEHFPSADPSRAGAFWSLPGDTLFIVKKTELDSLDRAIDATNRKTEQRVKKRQNEIYEEKAKKR
jgi:RHS repeat-associated protein